LFGYVTHERLQDKETGVALNSSTVFNRLLAAIVDLSPSSGHEPKVSTDGDWDLEEFIVGNCPFAFLKADISFLREGFRAFNASTYFCIFWHSSSSFTGSRGLGIDERYSRKRMGIHLPQRSFSMVVDCLPDRRQENTNTSKDLQQSGIQLVSLTRKLS
jgi:hypothetical protein